tara:strand:+ start:340 stop:507 length:168 start_codon:yes stop_codon:yes gene_type:complete
VSVTHDNGATIQGDFPIDNGSSDALWLFDQHDKIEKPASFFFRLLRDWNQLRCIW